MSESKTPCPLCDRPVGGVHEDFCPRSRPMQQALADEMAKRGQPRMFWTKGPMVVHRPGLRPKVVFNPGLPYVKPPKPWTAGGLPVSALALQQFLKDVMG